LNAISNITNKIKTNLQLVNNKMADNCLICSEELTIKNIVNPECGHSTCKDCFWKWTKDKNTCPFCRKSLLCNNEELQDIQHMRDLLDHRTRIVRQVEEAYTKFDNIQREYKEKKRTVLNINKKINEKNILCDKLDDSIKYLKNQRNDITKTLNGNYAAYQYYKDIVNHDSEKDRSYYQCIENTDVIECCECFCIIGKADVMKDIKILGRSVAAVVSYLPLHQKVREINLTRKKRKKFREERLKEGTNFDLENLFKEQQPELIEPDEDNHINNIFQEFFMNRDYRVEPIPLEENIIQDFTPEERDFILERILLRQASNVYRRRLFSRGAPNRLR